jgi:hypothetical protein
LKEIREYEKDVERKVEGLQNQMEVLSRAVATTVHSINFSTLALL